MAEREDESISDPKDAFFLLEYMRLGDVKAAAESQEYPLDKAEKIIETGCAQAWIRQQKRKATLAITLNKEEIIFHLARLAKMGENKEPKDIEFARKCYIDIARLQGFLGTGGDAGKKPDVAPPASHPVNVNTYVQFGPSRELDPSQLEEGPDALPEAGAIHRRDDLSGDVFEGVYREMEPASPGQAEIVHD